MRNPSFIDLICLIGLISCSPKENAPDPFARPVYDSNTVLQSSNFRAIPDASLITISLKADKTIPVKGTLNIERGVLNLDKDGLTEMNLVIDEASWDSGLTERDDLVKKFFLNPLGQGIHISFASSDQKLIETLRKQKKLTSFKAVLSLAWGDAELTLHPTLSIGLTPQGYLAVRTDQPVPLNISELKHQRQLTRLIEAAIATRKEMSIDDVILVEADVQFAPIVK